MATATRPLNNSVLFPLHEDRAEVPVPDDPYQYAQDAIFEERENLEIGSTIFYGLKPDRHRCCLWAHRLSSVQPCYSFVTMPSDSEQSSSENVQVKQINDVLNLMSTTQSTKYQ